MGFYYPQAQFMHHKILVVDQEVMITGSYNWSFTAEHRNYENITVHQGPSQRQLIDSVLGEWDRLWDLRRNMYEDFRDAGENKDVPVNHDRHPKMLILD